LCSCETVGLQHTLPVLKLTERESYDCGRTRK
jgi:hypothetical protein